MRSLLLLLVVPLWACPPPPPLDCDRTLIDPSGTANGGFAGGVGGSGGTLEAPLGVVGAPLALTVFAPLSACEPDTLRADATLVDPNDGPVQLVVERPVSRAGSPSAVSVSFVFTPSQPGVHTLKVAFEPSLGVRSVLIDVARDGLSGASTRVPLPAGASCVTWPLSDDTVACEEQGAGFVSVSSVDGGLTRFSGAELVVADDVLWSIDGTSNTLERRVFEDGGVRVTHRFPNFPVTPTPALHDVDVALRYRASGMLTRVRVTPTGEALGDFSVDRFLGPPLAYFVENDDALYRWSPNDCFTTPCTNFPDVAGLEPGVVWRTSNNGTFDAGRFGIDGFERPPHLPESPRFSLKRSPRLNSTSPAHSFERVPLWLNDVLGQNQFLVSIEDGAVAFSAWPLSGVLTVGRHHLVLSDGPGFVKVVKR